MKLSNHASKSSSLPLNGTNLILFVNGSSAIGTEEGAES